MIIGGADTGKSSLGKYLCGRFAADRRPLAFIDGDPGQSRLGPPTTLSLNLPSSGPQKAIRRVFIGSVTPAGHMLPMLTGVFRLVQAAQAEGADPIVYDTSGLIAPSHGGINLKLAEIELLRPQVILAIQRERELETLLSPLRICGPEIFDLCTSRAVRHRDLPTRREHRRSRFTSYFSRAEPLTLALSEIALFPGPPLEPGRLVSLEEGDRFTRALGIVQRYFSNESKVVLLAPPHAGQNIKVLRPGSMLVDPHTFEDRFTR